MPKISAMTCALARLLPLLGLVLAGSCLASGPDFNREVRPILSRNCFKCHGPDDKVRKAGLRLDVPGEGLKILKSGKRPIVPGDVAKSELVARLFQKDPDEQMPPPATKLSLSAQEKETLRRWVAAGAKYDTHWAFVPPVPAPLPKIKAKTWPKNPIDRFVLARLESLRLKPAPAADRYTCLLYTSPSPRDS